MENKTSKKELRILELEKKISFLENEMTNVEEFIDDVKYTSKTYDDETYYIINEESECLSKTTKKLEEFINEEPFTTVINDGQGLPSNYKVYEGSTAVDVYSIICGDNCSVLDLANEIDFLQESIKEEKEDNCPDHENIKRLKNWLNELEKCMDSGNDKAIVDSGNIEYSWKYDEEPESLHYDNKNISYYPNGLSVDLNDVESYLYGLEEELVELKEELENLKPAE